MTLRRLLVVEDRADDAELVARQVRKAWPDAECRRVETDAAIRDALREEWDALVIDYTLPGLNALRVLEIAHELGYDGPAIVVSGTVDEETTVAAMRAGAHDYVMKDNLRRLVPALERELHEAQVRAETREAQRRLGETEQLYQRLVRQLPGFVWTTDTDLRLTSSGGGVSLTPALPHEAIAGLCVGEAAESIALFDEEQHRRALAGEHVQHETAWAGRDYLVHLEPFRGEDGEVEGCVGIALDLTERREMERALAESEGRFRALIESSVDITTITTADETIRYVSPSAERVLGWTPEELVGRKTYEIFHPDEAPGLIDYFATSLDAAGSFTNPPHRLRAKDGSWRIVESVSVNLLDDPTVQGVVNTVRDVTERCALEERLRAHERLEAIGQLAGGVAHDFNNVLLVIRGYASMLAASLDDPDRLADVDEISKAADRAASLTRQLLALGRRQVVQPELLSVPDAVRGLESLLRRAVTEGIALSLELADDVPPILIDPAHLEQLVLNLVVNARDAVEDAGTIAVRVRSRTLTAEDDALTPPLPPGTYVTLEVADDGCGIAPDVLPHVFEPFFTTKPEGQGTGLGLATVYGIVTQAGGSVGIETAVGEGSTVAVHLPASPDAVEEAAPDAPPDAALATGTEHVLLVEDEEPVRTLVQRVLSGAGYRVESAARPSEALERLGADGFDLLLTDVVMPEMSGYELAERARSARPGLRLLFISGYSHDVAKTGLAPGLGPRLLQKPFTAVQLARAVRSVLDEKAAR